MKEKNAHVVADSQEWSKLELNGYSQIGDLLSSISEGWKLGIIALLIFAFYMKSSLNDWNQLAIILAITSLAIAGQFLENRKTYATIEKTDTNQNEYDHASGAERQAGGT